MFRLRNILVRFGPLALSAGVLIWHALQYNFVTDDAFISFVFARNLAQHGQLVFNPGMNPVEGYTNFLWTLLLGLLMLVGLQPELTSLVLGLGFAIGTLILVFRLSAHLAGGDSAWDHLAPALLALSAGYACWASGGLETQMFTFWVILALSLYARGDEDGRAMRRLGPVLALAAMTRPEGLLVAAALAAHRLALTGLRDRRLRPTRDQLLCVAYFLALWAPWYAWRWWYYGYPFPNTYYVKAAGPAAPGYAHEMMKGGLYYVGTFLKQSDLVYALPLVLAGLLGARPRSRRFVFGSAAALVGAAYLAYTVRVGGDFMGLHRFVMPLFPVAALGAALGLRLLCGLVRGTRARLIVALAAAGLLLAAHGTAQLRLTVRSLRWGNFANDHGIDTPAFLRVYAHDRAVIGQHMRPCFKDSDFVVYGGVGAKPYYAGVRGIDVFGLVSERIAHNVPRTVARAGHNKWAPDQVLLTYHPDFIFSCYSLHRDPGKPHWNCSPGPWEARGYRPVTVHIPGLLEKGEYYTFLVKKDRPFTCPGLVE